MFQFIFGIAFGAAGYWAWQSFGRDLLGMGSDQDSSYGGFNSGSSSTGGSSFGSTGSSGSGSIGGSTNPSSSTSPGSPSGSV